MRKKIYPESIENNVSDSKLSCFRKCLRKFLFQYILHTPIDFKCVDGAIGEITHEFARQMTKFNFKSEERLVKKALYYLSNHDNKGFNHTIRLVDKIEKKRYEEKTGLMICMLKSLYHYISICKKYNLIVDFEKRFKAPFYLNSLDYVWLEGRFDLIIKSNLGYAIIDYKTGFMPPEEYMLRDYQMTIYQWAFTNTYDKPLEYMATCHYEKNNSDGLSFNKINLRSERDFLDLKSLISSYKKEVIAKLQDAPMYDKNDIQIYKYHPLHKNFPKNPDRHYCKALCEYERKCREVKIDTENENLFFIKLKNSTKNEQLYFDFYKEK